MKKRKLFLIALSLIMAVSLIGCSGNSQKGDADSPAEDNQDASPGEGELYVVITSLHQLEFFDALKGGVNDAANEIGAKWYYAGPQELAPDQVSQAIDQAVAQGVNGIVLHGQFPETGAAVDNAIDSGVPVIIVNTDIPSKRLSFLGCDPYNAGVEMGRTLADLIGGKGEVITSTWLSGGQASALENQRGVEDALAEYPDIKIVTKVDDKADANEAATAIGAALQANPDVVGIVGMQAPSGVGAATAVREAGMKGKVKIVGRDRDQATLELIDNDEIHASFAQNSYVEGYIALKWLHDYNNGKLKVVSDYVGAGVNPIPPIVDSGSIIITKENTDQFKEPYKYDVTAK